MFDICCDHDNVLSKILGYNDLKCNDDELVNEIYYIELVHINFGDIQSKLQVVTQLAIRPMKLDYQFLAQIFENLMRVGGYYSLFSKSTSKHDDFCQKTVRSTLIILALYS